MSHFEIRIFLALVSQFCRGTIQSTFLCKLSSRGGWQARCEVLTSFAKINPSTTALLSIKISLQSMLPQTLPSKYIDPSEDTDPFMTTSLWMKETRLEFLSSKNPKNEPRYFK